MSSSSLDEVLRKAIDLNIRYYSSLGRLTADYWRELATAVAEPMKAAVSSATAPVTNNAITSAAPASAAAKGPAAMVLEAEPGSVALGVFLVENHLDSEVDSTVVASFFKDSAGVAIQPELTFDPARIVLKPGEQLLVRVSCTITPGLEPGTRYTGELAVPGLKGTSIPVVLRSRTKP
jgi:hypothetical protein